MNQMIKQDNNIEPEARWKFRALCTWIFAILLITIAIVVRLTVMTTGVRLLLVCTLVFGLFTGLVYFTRYLSSYPRLVYPAIFFLMLLVTWAVLGSKPPDTEMLRVAYTRRLVKFTGVKYVRGGESHSGIDCSGLARAALWQSMILQGVREVNPRLLGTKMWGFWWRDLSAADLMHEKYSYTKIIGHAPKLAGYISYRLEPGDIAITSGTMHVLIYLGDSKWIEASPDERKVVANKALEHSARPYFNMPATIVRWWIFEQKQ